MQTFNRTISLKQILAFLLVGEFFLLILSPFKILILVIPFIPIFIYALNLKVVENTVSLQRILKYIVIAIIFLIISMFILFLLEHQMFVMWRRSIGLISAIYFITVVVKCSFFTESQNTGYYYANNFLLLKQINILYLLFFGLLSILIYNDFLGFKSSSPSILINTRWLLGGIVIVSIVIKIIFLSKMKDSNTKDITSNTPSQKEIEEYKSRLHNHFENKQLYLRNDLNRIVISQVTQIPIEHIDYLFNNYLELDLNYFIAEYRISYALNLMQEKGDVYTLNAISYESGFRSRATFNKYFKIFTSVLPSEYLNKSKRFTS